MWAFLHSAGRRWIFDEAGVLSCYAVVVEVGADNAKKPVLVADVERVIETAELEKDAASGPIIVLDEATPTAVADI